MKNKVLISGLMGGIAYFLLGWLIYGFMLRNYMKENCDQAGMRPMEEMIMWAIALSNLFWGYFLALIFGWTNTTGLYAGMQKGVVIGLFVSLAMDLGMYSMSTMFLNPYAIIVDVAAFCVMSAFAGAVVGWFMGMGMDKKEA